MADEVVIRLQAQSAQLEASIGRLESSLNRLESKSKKTNSVMQTGAQRTSKSINNQNKSFTLMVAKLALVAFAVQTMANIFQNTFGAILKDIDDFQIAAIGAAAAVTSLTASSEPIGEVFNQNLEASLATFEALELVASKFFSTGQELQLAFNTLAQRGVVIREEEFEILAKLTDQIKLLTGGQNSQIQIQQELRAILDGNVRTTTAFGKSLQARGVDIQQLSREVRATGSIQIFEQFLTGLDAASGSIRRTLTSVLTTFTSLVSILNRNIFQDTYDDVVALITNVNNVMIDQRGLITSIGKALVSNIEAGLKRVLLIMQQWANILGDIVADDFLKLLAILTVVAKLTSGPVRVFLVLGVALAAVTGNINDVDKAFNILIGTMRIVLKLAGDIVRDAATGFQQLARRINFGLATNEVKKLQQEIRGLDNLLRAAPVLGDGREDAITRRAEAVKELQIAEQSQFDEAAKSIALENGLRIKALEVLESQNILGKEGAEELAKLRGITEELPFDSSISDGLSEIEAKVEEILKDLGLDTAQGRLKDYFSEFKAELTKLKKIDFAPTGILTTSDNTLERQQLAGLNSQIDATRKTTETARKRTQALESAGIKQLAAEREITALRAFEAQNALRESGLKAEIADLRVQEDLVRSRAASERRAIEAAAAADDGPTKITIEAKLLALDKLRTKEALSLSKLNDQIGKTQASIASDAVNSATLLTKETEKVNRLLEDRGREFDQRFATTSADRLVETQQLSQRAKSDFATQNKGDQPAIDQFNQQQDSRDLLAAVQPQIDAFTKAIDDTFNALIDGIVTGAFEFRDLAQTISQDLIKSGLEDLIANTKKLAIGGLESIFEGLGLEAAGSAAQALALGLGLLLAVLSKVGSEGEFTASGGAGGSGVNQSAVQTRGLIGGSTALPIAEINNGLLEALIPTNVILNQIERNTRALVASSGAAGGDIDQLINDRLDAVVQDTLLQNA